MTLKDNPNSDKFRTKFHLVELELNAILEITQAINNNIPEESLYMMYKFTLRANLNIERLALYVIDEEDQKWNCKVNFGTETDFQEIPLDESALETIKESSELSSLPFEDKNFDVFDVVIPVYHKDKVLAYVFLDKIPQDAISSELQRKVDTRFVQTLTNIIIVAIENKKLVRRQLRQEAFNKELEIAKKVQSLLFPKSLPYETNLQVRATYYPNYLIGGDYYDFIPITKEKFIFCIADVSGKGIPAALLMSNFQASLRTLVRQTNDLKTITEELNQSIYDNAEGEHFITFFVAMYDGSNSKLHYINAGHNPAVLFAESKEPQLLDTGTTVLGVFSPLPFLKETTINQLENFMLFSYTDGITEVRDKEGEEYGLDRLLDFIKEQKQEELEDIHENLIQEINSFREDLPYTDDVTILSCRVKK